jgi:hypothetical protein
MKVSIVEFCEKNESYILDIDKQLFSSGNQMVYYSSGFISFLKTIMPGSKFYYVTVTDNDNLLGLLPFALKKNGDCTVLNSLPFYGSYGGPLVLMKENEADIVNLLLNGYCGFAYEIKADIANFIENPLQPIIHNIPSESDFETIDERIGQFTEFPEQHPDLEENLMAIFHSKTRNMIRKGEKTNLTIELKDDDASFEWLHSEHTRSILNLGGLPKALTVFSALRSSFGRNCELYIGYANGEPVCGVLIILYAQTIEYFTPVVKDEWRESQVLSALIYRIMLKMIDRGFKQWNWGGTWLSQEGVYRFKKRWGSVDYPYRYYSRKTSKSIMRIPRESLQINFPFYYLYKY